MIGKLLVYVLVVAIITICLQCLYNNLVAPNVGILAPVGFVAVLGIVISGDLLRRVAVGK